MHPLDRCIGRGQGALRVMHGARLGRMVAEKGRVWHFCPPSPTHSASSSPFPLLHLPGSFAPLFPFKWVPSASFRIPLLLHVSCTLYRQEFLSCSPSSPAPPPTLPFRSSSPLPPFHLTGSFSHLFPFRPLSSHLAHSTILALSPWPPIHSASSSPWPSSRLSLVINHYEVPHVFPLWNGFSMKTRGHFIVTICF